MSPEKQRPGHVLAGARSAPAGLLPAGREASGRQWDVRARNENTLRELGLPTALDRARALADAGQVRAAGELRDWANESHERMVRFLQCLPNASQRQLRLRMCGVAMVAKMPGGRIGAKPRGCKDRLCPRCSARRSRRLAAKMRAHVTARDRVSAMRTRRGEVWRTRVWLLTLTQRKRPGELPRLALDRLLAAWRRFTERQGRGLMFGGVRSMEVTSRAAGSRVGRHVVEHGGLHAHLHVVVELMPEVSMGDVVDAWLKSADAESWCQEAHRIESRPDSEGRMQERGAAVYQACKYPVETEGLLELIDGAPGYVSAVLQALHGRRTVATFGGWRGLELAREDKGKLVYGDRALVTLATNEPGEASDVKWSDGTTDPALDVLRSIIERGEIF